MAEILCSSELKVKLVRLREYRHRRKAIVRVRRPNIRHYLRCSVATKGGHGFWLMDRRVYPASDENWERAEKLNVNL